MDPRDYVPQRPPFLFLDGIDELTAVAAKGRYRFKLDEWFFNGHFPGNPIVPGAIQIEAMAQLLVAVGTVAAREAGLLWRAVLFTRVDECQFHKPLLPGDEVVVSVERDWLRLRTLQARTALRHVATGELVCEAVLRGALVQ
jgi:3-hydroxymyristoyl/3-hydroxydecanoyl-(acyl carrier protein) dehydratase